MPAYSATAIRNAIYPGDQKAVFSAETPASGTSSICVAIGNAYGGFDPGLRLDLFFVGDPGAFSVSLATTDTDAANAYTTAQTAITAATGSASAYYARAEYPNIRAAFARVLVTTQNANDVNMTATIVR